MIRKIIFCAICALALVACKKGTAEDYVPPQAITGEVIDVTSTSATVRCEFVTSRLTSHIRLGAICSTDEELTAEHYMYQIMKKEYIRDYTFENLTPGTTYYYRAMMYYESGGGVASYNIYGEVKSFTTLMDV